MKKKKDEISVDEILKNAERIAYYSRVSTKEQSKEGKEEGQQFGKVSDFLKRHGKSLNDDAKFSDIVSAYSKPFTEREKLNALLHAVENKEYDAIVVSDRDRLSRQTEEHFVLRDLLERIGIPVVIASRGELYKSDDFIRTLIEDALTRLESDNISTRTKAALKSLLENEKYIGGKPPYGYETEVDDEKKVKKEQKVIRFKPLHEKLANVKEIFRLYKKSETFSSIAKEMNHRDTSEEWTATKVKDIITNPIYTGNLVYNRYKTDRRTFAPTEKWKWIKSPLFNDEGIVISLDDWWYCWYKYTRVKGKRPRYLNTSYYLNDLIYCHCGELMRGRDKRTNVKGKGKTYGSRFYFCTKCKEKVEVDYLNHLVLNLIFDLAAPELLTWMEVKNLIVADIADKEITVLELKNKIAFEENNLNLLKAFSKSGDKKDGLLHESEQHELLAYLLSKGDSEVNLMNYKKDLREVEAEHRKLKEIFASDTQIQEWVRSFFRYSKWSPLTHLEIRNLVMLLIEKCTLISHKKVKLKIKSLPPETLDLRAK
jgi:site-specific DNA recombinase